MSNTGETVQPSATTDVETSLVTQAAAQSLSTPTDDAPEKAKLQQPNTAALLHISATPTGLSTVPLNEPKVEEQNVQAVSLGGELNVVRQLSAAPISLSELKVQKSNTSVTFNEFKVHQLNNPVALGVQQISNPVSLGEIKLQQLKSHPKLVVPPQAASGSSQVLQKVVNPPLITVLNSTGPLTVVKNLCVSSGFSNNPSQYSVVNSTPLSTTNAIGKTSTITVLNCGQLSPVNVAKTFDAHVPEAKIGDGMAVSNIPSNPGGAPTVVENRGHNVFVKNTSSDPSLMEGTSQGHKLLTATNFLQGNVLGNISKQGPINGQRSRIKMSNTVPTIQQPAVITKMTMPSQQKYFNRQKITGLSSQSRHISKIPGNNVLNSLGQIGSVKPLQDKPSSSFMHSTVSKNHFKPLPTGYIPKYPQGIKTLPPHQKIVPGGQVPRTGVRTIPPQKVQKMANKPNYIGKHAIQGQKVRQPYGKGKSLKPPNATNYLGPSVAEKQLTFNQALTAQIIETLSNPSTPPVNSKYEMMSSRYDNAFTCPDKQFVSPPVKDEEITKSGLDALSLICQAVLLDHNYNATLPCESPTRPTPPIASQAQVNGVSSTSMAYAPPPKRRTLSNSMPISVPSPSLSNVIPLPQKPLELGKYDDDNASDVSDVSDHKHDTEGEETDTAPEAEDVKNEDPMDHYGDYVTRCICGFLHDDGYMVECDKCKVWQHVQCVVKNKQVPDEYLCEVCDPSKPIDRQKARLLQQQYIRDRQLIDAKLKRELTKIKQQQSCKFKSDTDSSDAENEGRINVPKTKPLINRRKSESSKVTKKESKETPIQRRQKRKERKLVKKKSKPPTKHPQSEDDNHDTWSTHLPQLRQWIEKYEEAVTNHYSPELRARISSIRVNGTHLDQTIQYDSNVVNCRVHTQPLTEIKYLVSTSEVATDVPIIELRGKYMLSNQHRNLCGSLNTRLHTQKPGPFLFFYRLPKDNTEICVDTRTYGNAARFIRRSCKPNTELRHCIEKGVLHLYIVSIASIEKDCELTLKHESHDLASIGTTQIACACGRPDECSVNKTTIKRNGEIPERKRRAKRSTVSYNASKPAIKEEQPSPVAVPEVQTLLSPKEEKVDIEDHDLKETEIKTEIKEEFEEKVEVEPVEVEPPPPDIKTEVKEVLVEEKVEKVEKIEKIEKVEKIENIEKVEKVETKELEVEEEKPTSPVPVSKRRVSHKSDKEDDAKDYSDPIEQPKSKSKKLSREERKLEAILRAIEQMEKADQRKQEHQAKQAHRRESEPSVNAKDEDKGEPKTKRRRRRGRARTTSTTQSSRRSRLNSTDSYMTSGDEILLSPNDGIRPTRPSKNETENRDLRLNLPGGDNRDRTPPRDTDTNSNSTHSSPETPQLSSACLLVQAAVEPLESGFKFPKTKKGLMNEWLNKTPDSSAITSSPVSKPQLNTSNPDDSDPKLMSPEKPMTNFSDSLQTRGGNAKKRWLRQAISEDHSTEGSTNRPDSPPSSEMVAPPKKRKLPRETLTNKESPLTPLLIPTCNVNNMVVNETTSPINDPGLIIPNRMSTRSPPFPIRDDTGSNLISKPSMFGTGEQLVGAVEKTLSILGFENPPGQATSVAQEKRKVRLSISEYRQRKKIHTDKPDEPEDNSMENPESVTNNEELSAEFQKELPPAARQRSVSTSSTSSLTSDDDPIVDIPIKASVFNCEPTELERQREISNMRLKRAFGLTNEPNKVSDPILRTPPLLSSLSVPNFSEGAVRGAPTQPILRNLIPEKCPALLMPGVATPPLLLSLEKPECNTLLTEEEHIEIQDLSKTAKTPDTPMPAKIDDDTNKMDFVDVPSAADKDSSDTNKSEQSSVPEGKTSDEAEVVDKENPVEPNMFYTPDDEDPAASSVTESSVGFVPPFNNPVYPNNNFNSYTSSIDDDSRFQSRNPSPPPEMDSSSLNLPC